MVVAAWEEIKVSGVVQSVDATVRPAAGGEFDGVGWSGRVPDSGLQGSLDTTEGSLHSLYFSLADKDKKSPELSPRQLCTVRASLPHPADVSCLVCGTASEVHGIFCQSRRTV